MLVLRNSGIFREEAPSWADGDTRVQGGQGPTSPTQRHLVGPGRKSPWWGGRKGKWWALPQGTPQRSFNLLHGLKLCFSFLSCPLGGELGES